MTHELNGIKYTEMLITLAEKELILAMRESKKKCDAEEKGKIK